MRRYQRRNAIFPTSNEAIALRVLSNSHHESYGPVLGIRTENQISNDTKFQKLKPDLDDIFKDIKKLSAASAA